MVLTVSFALSSTTNSFLSPSLNGLTATSPGWAGFASAQLGISNGCQDHTSLFTHPDEHRRTTKSLCNRHFLTTLFMGIRRAPSQLEPGSRPLPLPRTERLKAELH